MKPYFVLLLILVGSSAAFGRNDFWMASRYSVSLRFGAAGLGKMNAPTPKSLATPEFPAEMIQARLEGDVTVDYTVAVDGRVFEIVVVSASTEPFKKAAVSSVQTWIFASAIALPGGKPVPARMRCKILFRTSEEEDGNLAPDPAGKGGRN
jgi:TonB family protein